MAYPKAYIEYLVHFHGSRDYFECHEILEEYWKTAEQQQKDSIWIGLIQLAVSQYHHRRGNFSGAYKTLQKSLHILLSQPETVARLGLEAAVLYEQLQLLLDKMKKEAPYESINLPIVSRELLDRCRTRSQELNLEWRRQNPITDTSLIHRHKTRDRSKVIQERNEAIRKRQIKETNSTKKE